jgi:hypothetical protein
MGFDVLRADVDNVDAWLVTYTNDIAGSLQAVTEGAQGLSGLASFTGSAAEAVKAYWGEAHALAAAAIALAGTELAMRCTEYAQGYDGIDADKDARFSQDALETASTDCQGRQTDFADRDARLRAAVDAVSDLIGGWAPGAAAITDGLSSLATDPSTLCSSVSAYEASSASGLAEGVDALLAGAQSLVGLLGAGTGGAAYVPGTVAGQPWAADLYAAIQASQTYQEGHSAAYEAAIAGLQGRMQERHDEYVAAEAEARRQEGIVEMGTAALTVLAGAAAIVLTGGAATPVVVGLFAVSTAFQASNFAEGLDDFRLGSAGDITTEALNPLRDTVFLGNQELYDGVAFAAATASSLAIPVGGVLGEAGSAVRAGEMTLGQAARGYGAQLARGLVVGEIQGQAVDLGLSVTVDPVCYALLGDGAAGQLAVRAVHAGAGMLDPLGGDGDVDAGAAPRARAADADVGVPRAGLDLSGDLGIDASRLGVGTPEAVPVPEGEAGTVRTEHEPITDGPYIKDGKQNGRPRLTGEAKLEFEQAVYERQVDAGGILRDPNTRKAIDWKPGQPRKGVADFGHTFGEEYWKAFERYRSGKWSLEQLKEHEFNSENFQIESPSSNRSRKFEEKGI